MEQRIKHILDEVLDLTQTHHAIIGCSAGPDSVFLAHMISKLIKGNHLLVYFNHQQRPDEIQEEIDIVKRLGKNLAMSVYIETLSKPVTTQNEFRNERLKSLEKLAKKLSVNIVLLGHHLDDDIETLFSQLSKGGTTGLKGISKISRFKEFDIIHPLLFIPKEEILNYLHDQKIEYATDSSNLKLKYSRNKFRFLIKDFYQIQDTSSKNISYSLQYLKEIQQEYVKLSQLLFDVSLILGSSHLLTKEKVISTFKFPERGFSVFLEVHFNQYINKDHQRILSNNLISTQFTILELENIVVEMDYKWVLIRKKESIISFPKIKLENDLVIKSEVGNFCCTTFDSSFSSNTTYLACSKNMFDQLSVTSIEKLPIKLKNQKQLLRKALFSPIQQRWWPVVYICDRIVWIPGVIHFGDTGNICITFKTNF